jgi:RNA polymerase sigma-70 factor (ECF subfamily)
VNDEELLQRACQGDQAAFAEFYNRYYAPLFAFARRIVRQDALAEDVAQEAFVSVLVNLPRFDPDRGRARGWLFRIAYYLAINIIRRQGREPPTPAEKPNGSSALANTIDLQPTPEDLAMAREHRAALHHCLEELRSEDRVVVQLIYLEGFTFAEAAEILNWPLGTVQSRSGRARAELRKCLKRKGVEL